MTNSVRDSLGLSRPVRLLCSIAASAGDAQTAAGRCRYALSQDRRLQWVVAGHAGQGRPQAHWAQGLRALMAGELSALVWMADDLALHDFLLADRVQEWQAQGLSTLVASKDGREVLRVQMASHVLKSDLADRTGADLVHDARGRMAMSVAGQALVDAAPPSHAPLLLVTASRAAPQRFYTHTALGRSVHRLRAMGVPLRVRAACSNRQALAEVYNAAIDPAFADHIVVFVHDDVVIEDHFIGARLEEALQQFDLVGLAGSRQREPGQPAWPFPSRVGQWEHRERLLGCVGHDTTGRTGRGRKMRKVSHFGATRGPAQLLDGLLLAMRMQTLLDHPLRFDPALAFDFYDLDFCRRAEQAGLRPGVWPIAVTHLSAGDFDSPSWCRTYPVYLEKWGERPPEHTP